jgi:PAS domain S-box-containing protein
MTTEGPTPGGPADRLRAWLGRSIGNRITAAAVTVTMLVSTALGALSYGAVRLLVVQGIRADLEHRAALVEQRVRTELDAIVQDLAGLAANSFIANGLVDSLGRDTYLLPFLREHRVPGEAAVEITLCDFRGVPIATNHGRDASLPPGNASVAGALRTGTPVAEILSEGGNALLILSVPVIFPPTGQAEGVLVGRIRLRDHFAGELASPGGEYQARLLAAGAPIAAPPAPAGAGAPGLVLTRRAFRLAPPLAAIPFTLEVGRLRGPAFAPLRTVTLLFLLIGMATMLLVFQLTRAATRRLVLPLVALSRTAGEIAESGSLQARAAVVAGDDEIGALAAAFNTMLARLQGAAEELEHRVEERTRELGRVNAELRASEDALRQKTEELERFFSLALDLLCIAGTDGRFRLLNLAWERTLGYSREELVADTFLSFVHPDDVPATREAVGRLARQQEVLNFVNRYRCKDGTYRWIEWRAAPAGPLIYAAARDITDRKRGEEALGELNRTLEERVEREISLRLEQERMLVHQSRHAAMGEMIGAIAHQWRQPLNTVGAIVQDIRDAQAHGELTEAYLDRSVENAMQQIQFMSKTIDDFRNFFHPEKEKRSFDAKQAAGEVLRMLSSQLLKLRISFRLTCHTHQRTYVDFSSPIVSCGEMQLVGYENELKQVILNLVNNAKDAILDRRGRAGGPGGAEERGLISLGFERAGERIVIRVTDNGGGIADHARDRIFDPYFTTKGQGRGTGIGLYMSKMIIENSMGGRLTARNVDGGAEFRIEV